MEEQPVLVDTAEQTAITSFVASGKGNLIVDALAGTGKCLGSGTPVLLFDGRVIPVEDVRTGMLLMGPDSEPRRVLTTNIGRGPLYRISPVKGESWVCNDIHVMTLTGTGFWHDQIRDVPLNEHLAACGEQRPDRNWKLLRTGVKWPAQPIPLDPYLAGLWLGDGTFDSPTITNADPEVAAYCRKIAPQLGVECVVTETPRNNSNLIRFRFGARGTFNTRTERNAFQDAVQAFKVDNEKVIPWCYLSNSRENRLALLAGLIDTDGFVTSGCVEITSKYDRLADAILFLARSLGFAAYMSKKRATIKSLNFEGVYNRIMISGDIDEIPCLVKRRQSAPRTQIKRVTVTGWDAEPIGEGDYYGFTLDGDGRFLLGDFTVTHNTTTIIKSLAQIPQRSILMCAFNKRIAIELEAKLPKMPKGTAVHVKTFHAIGLSIVKHHFRHLQVSAQGTEELINRAAGKEISFKMRRCAVNLLRMIKETRAERIPPTADEAHAIGLEYALFKTLNEVEISLCIEAVRDAYILSANLNERATIDFCDMVWAAATLDLAPPSRYQAIFVDELQDISEPQLKLLLKLMVPGTGRFIGVGDKNQQIYGWRGSMGAKVWKVAHDQLGSTFLPLTMTWRCSAAIVKEANGIVPQLRARPNAPAGHVVDTKWLALPAAIRAGVPIAHGKHTFVLSRTNASLLDVALYLWRERVQFELSGGEDVLEPLFSILDKLDLQSEETYRKTLAKWVDEELARAEKLNATAYADRVEEQFNMLQIAITYTKPKMVRKLLTDLMVPNSAGVLLSTVHKVKGLEAERVFLLKQTFARYAKRPCFTCRGKVSPGCGVCHGTGFFKEEKIPQEELNIEYVAITRAKSRLVWVDIEDRFTITEATEDPLLAVVRHQLGVVSERDQLIAAVGRFENGGMPHAMAEGFADPPRGDHARDTMMTDFYESEEP